ncbi:hypothetical protein IFM89_000845 [Coptis chinensis]|uniref:Pentatricopeptide repeat-containing protein n=1 Tax=Coptis chinensis TaxID=261450 RepID=A0A835ISK2_9MAGN|nr:hypothetical protein IFM89_000845 [Coptis chinensis]
MLRENLVEDMVDMFEQDGLARAKIEKLQVEMGNLFCSKEKRIVEIVSKNNDDNTAEQRTLMGKLYGGKAISLQDLADELHQCWQIKGPTKIELIAKGYYKMEFEEEKELDHVKENGPWLIQWFIFSVNKGIHIDEVASAKKFDLVDFWIQIYGIPRERITEENVRRMGDILGKVKAMDLGCQKEFRTPVARVRVRMNIKERLMKGIDLRTEKGEVIPLTFKYEKLEILCYFCGCIGHDIHYCNKKETYSIEMRKQGGSPRDIKNNFSFMLRANVFFNGEASTGPVSVTISGTPRKPRPDQIPPRNRSLPGKMLWYGGGVLTSPLSMGTVESASDVRGRSTEVREHEVRENRTASLEAEVEGGISNSSGYNGDGSSEEEFSEKEVSSKGKQGENTHGRDMSGESKEEASSSGGKPDRAVKVFLSMHEHGCVQDLPSFNTLLDVLFKRTPRALEILKEMVERGNEPSVSTYNILLKGFFRAGQIKEAWEFFLQMKKRGCVIDVVTYTTLVHGFGVVGEIAKARKVFNGMIKEGCLPSVVTYTAFIQVLCKKDNVENAIVVFEEMLRKGYVPNVTTYAVVIRGLCHAGDMNRAMEFMERMKDDGCEANLQIYNVVIRYFIDAGDLEKALEIFEKMCSGDCLPNLDTYNILISAMFVRKKVDDLVLAGKLLVEMVDRGFMPRRFTFNRVLNGLLLTGNQAFAKEILRAQSRSGRLPRQFKL